jgi:hypothetical protein
VRALNRASHARFRAKPTKQWEITLANGMKQYVLGHTEAEAINRWLGYDTRGTRDVIASIREYGLMPKHRVGGTNGNAKHF